MSEFRFPRTVFNSLFYTFLAIASSLFNYSFHAQNDKPIFFLNIDNLLENASRGWLYAGFYEDLGEADKKRHQIVVLQTESSLELSKFLSEHSQDDLSLAQCKAKLILDYLHKIKNKIVTLRTITDAKSFFVRKAEGYKMKSAWNGFPVVPLFLYAAPEVLAKIQSNPFGGVRNILISRVLQDFTALQKALDGDNAVFIGYFGDLSEQIDILSNSGFREFAFLADVLKSCLVASQNNNEKIVFSQVAEESVKVFSSTFKALSSDNIDSILSGLDVGQILGAAVGATLEKDNSKPEFYHKVFINLRSVIKFFQYKNNLTKNFMHEVVQILTSIPSGKQKNLQVCIIYADLEHQIKKIKKILIDQPDLVFLENLVDALRADKYKDSQAQLFSYEPEYRFHKFFADSLELLYGPRMGCLYLNFITSVAVENFLLSCDEQLLSGVKHALQGMVDVCQEALKDPEHAVLDVYFEDFAQELERLKLLAEKFSLPELLELRDLLGQLNKRVSESMWKSFSNSGLLESEASGCLQKDISTMSLGCIKFAKVAHPDSSSHSLVTSDYLVHIFKWDSPLNFVAKHVWSEGSAA